MCPVDHFVQIKRLLPFAAALQGLVVLHAGTVAIAEREQGTVFDAYFVALLRHWAGRILAELESTEEWQSTIYTRREPVESCLEEVRAGGVGGSAGRIGALESVRTRIMAEVIAPPSSRTDTMTGGTEAGSPKHPVVPKSDLKPYRRPRLVRLGHMSEVTQKSGPAGDHSPNWPTRKR